MRSPEQDQFLPAVRALCGTLALGYTIALALPWTDPPYSIDEAEWYTGWGLLLEGLGGSTAPHACGREVCRGFNQFGASGLPTIAVVLAAVALVLVLAAPTRRRCTIAIVLNLVVLLGLVGVWSTLTSAANATSFPEQFNLRPGMLVTAIIAVSAVAATSTLRPGRGAAADSGS